MKRKFTKLMAAIALLVFMAPSMVGWGQVTWTASEQGYSNGQSLDGTSIELDDYITIQFDKNDGNTSPAYYNTGTAARLYPKNSLTVTPASGYQITGMTLTFSATGNTGTLGASVGSYSLNSTTGTWSGSSTQAVVLTNNATSGHARMQVLTVTYSETGGPQPTTYTVTYNANVTGVASIVDTYNEGANVTLRPANTFANEGYTFSEWNTQADGDGDAYDAGDEIEGIDENIVLYAIWIENAPSNDHWILTNLADLTASDVFVIVGNNGSNYAMSNDNGTGSAPAAVGVTVTGNEITGTVAANIQWNISGNATDGYTFYPNGSTTTWLYCTSSNNGVRVGTNDAKTFKMASNYLQHQGTSRYVGIYSSSDWRCYTSINSNIQNQTFAFYKKVTGGVVPPSITANNVEIEYNVTEGAIEYTINNGVEGGSLTATTESDWLTLGNDFTSPIAFACSANAAATARTATVTLTYTYGDSQTATKNVTVTQTGDPNYTSTIAEVRAQGTGAVVTQGIVTSCVGTTGYIQDATAAICVYGESLTVGDEIRVSGTLSDYNGLLEITSPVVTVLSSGNTIEPELMTIAEVVASTNQGWYIRIENATVTAINGKNVTIAQGESNVVVRFASEDDITFEVNDVISLNGNIGAYNGVQIANPQNVEVQAAPAEPSITLISNDPVFTPNSPYTIEFTHESGGGSSIDQVQCENFSSPLTEDDFSILYCDAEGNALESQEAPVWFLSAPSVTSESNNLYLGVTVNVNTSATAHTCYFKVGAANGTDMVYSDLVTVNQDGFVATITVNPTVVNATAAETDGTITVTYTNIDFTNAPEIVFYSDAEGTIEVEASYYADWFQAEINSDNNVDYLIGANDGEARTAYFKVYGLDIYVQDVYSDLVTINQAEYVVDYATLPFEFNGGRADIENTDGLTQEGLDSDYSSSPKLKFNTTGDWLLLHFNEVPGTLTFDIKNNSFSGGTFTVQTSEDGVTFTDLENYTSITGTQSEEFDNLGENVRYIKWIYTNKSSGNVGLGNITLAKYVAPTPAITVEPATLNVDAAEHDGTFTVTYTAIETSAGVEIHWFEATGAPLQSAPDWIDADINNDLNIDYLIEANDGAARTAYFKVYGLDADANAVYSDLVTVSQAAYVPPVEEPQFALFGGDLVEGDYIIYYDGRAMNNVVSSNRLQYAEIEPENNVITTDNAAIVWHIAPNNEGYWTIYSADANAYAASKDVKNQAQMLEDGTGDMAMWTVTEINGTYEFVNKKNAASGINANLRNNGTYGFACYATGTGGALSLYKYTETVATYTMEIAGYGDSEGGYYLIASPVLAVAPAADNGFLTDEYDLYYFDQSQQNYEWRNYEAKHFNLVAGKGYLYASQENTTLTFAGVPYTGNGEIALTYDENAEFAGWNLIGNPFGNNATINKPYYRMNEYGNGFESATQNDAVSIMEGVFVQATEPGQKAQFTQYFSKGETKHIAQVNIKVSGSDNMVDNAIIRFDNGETLSKFQLNQNSTKLYFTEGNQDYAIVRSNAQGEMPVNFKAQNNGTYTISVNAENAEANYLHLIDNMTGNDIDLLATPSYSFEAKTTDYASRFRLVFNITGVEENTNSTEPFAFFNGSEWVISNIGKATLQMVDLTGRILSSETINGNATINVNESKGIYMLRLVNGESVKVQKIMVK